MPIFKIKMKQLKDKKVKLATIKIYQYKEVFKDKGCSYLKDKLIGALVNSGYFQISTCFKDTKKGNKELLNFIKRECYLK